MAEPRLKLHLFHHNVEDWLLHVDVFLKNTSASDNQKFNALVGALPTEVVSLVRETVTTPPDKDKFEALKKALLECHRKPDHHHLHTLQTMVLGDTKPLLWQQMQVVNSRCSIPLPNTVLRYMHLQKLPSEVKLNLSSLDPGTPVTQYVAAADRMCAQLTSREQIFMTAQMERSTLTTKPQDSNLQPLAIQGMALYGSTSQLVSHATSSERVSPQVSNHSLASPLQFDNTAEGPGFQASVSKVTQPLDTGYLLHRVVQRLDDLERKVNHTHVGSQSDDSRRGYNFPEVCWYHATIGANTRRCHPPCKVSENSTGGRR